MWPAEVQDRRVFVLGIDRCYRCKHRLERVVLLNDADRKLYITRCNGVAIVKFGIFNQD